VQEKKLFLRADNAWLPSEIVLLEVRAVDADVGEGRRMGEANRDLKVVVFTCFGAAALAVVESTRWAKYTLVSRRIQGGRPSEASSTVVAGGLKQAAIMELILLAGDADLICDAESDFYGVRGWVRWERSGRIWNLSFRAWIGLCWGQGGRARAEGRPPAVAGGGGAPW
jgi:hypothetical protein